VVPVPNPQAGPVITFSVQLSGPVDVIYVRLYTRSFTLVGQAEFPGPWPSGWSTLQWNLPGLANGTYYIEAGSQASRHGKIAKLQIAH
jgi:hypothetical protein